MSNIPIRDIAQTGVPSASSYIVYDDGQMKKGLASSLADAIRPVASQSEAQAGSDNTKTMTPLRTKDSIAAEVGVTVQGYDTDLAAWAGKTAPSGAAVGTTDAQTLTNKTLTSPVINSPTGIVKADVGLSNVPDIDATNATNITTGTLPVARLSGIPNAALAAMPAATIKGNPNGSSGAPSDFTIQALTARGAPDANNDKLIIYDAAAGTLKSVTPSQIASAATAGVSSFAGVAGAITIDAATLQMSGSQVGVKYGTSGAVFGLLNASKTDSGNNIWNGTGHSFGPGGPSARYLITLEGGAGSGGGAAFDFKKNGSDIWGVGHKSAATGSGTSDDFSIYSFITGLEYSMNSSGASVIPASGYYGFGTTKGASGYGFRDSSGVPQVKRSGIAWGNVGTETDYVPVGLDPTGVADATAIINAAMAAYTSVLLPPGSFKTTGPLVSTNKNMRLRGSGQGVTRILSTHAAACISISIDNTSTPNIMLEVSDMDVVNASGGTANAAISITGNQFYPGWGGETQVLVEKVRVCSSTYNATTEKWTFGLYMANLSNPRCVNCTFHQLNNLTGTAIRVANDNTNVAGFVTFGMQIDRPLINGWQNGISITGSIEGIFITPYEIVVKETAIYIDGAGGPYGRANVFHIKGGDMAGQASVIQVNNCMNVCIDGVDVIRYASALPETHLMYLNAVEGLQITGNKLNTTAYQPGSYIVAMNAVKNAVMTGNHLRSDSTSNGVGVLGSSQGVLVASNMLRTVGGGAAALATVSSDVVKFNGNLDFGFAASVSNSGSSNVTNTNNDHY